MALRFQRRIKIMPGLTLVASKHGLGVSVGVPGARVSMTRQGLYGHAGIPGTGLAFREKLNPKGRRRATGGAAVARLSGFQRGGKFALTLEVEDDGEVRLSDAGGTPFTEEESRFLRRTYADQLRTQLRGLCERNNADLKLLGQVHHATPVPRSEPLFAARTFALQEPAPPFLPKAGFWATIWPPAKRKLVTKNAALLASFEAELHEWQADRDAFMAGETERRTRETKGVFTDLEAMARTLEDHLGDIPWPRETDVDFDLGDDSRTIAITLHLPDEESMPDLEWSVAGTRLKVSKKKISATRRRGIYRDYVHGVAVRVLGEIFARLPTIQVALVTGVIPGTDPATGQPHELALYSVIARRVVWSSLNFNLLHAIEPAETLALFDLRRAMTKTGLMKAVTAFSLDELEATI